VQAVVRAAKCLLPFSEVLAYNLPPPNQMKHLPRSLASACLLSCAVMRLEAQLPPPATEPIIGARMPALSPDGKRLAFVYRGDIWAASSDGGRAVPITSHVEMDAYPQFSPDGRWVAFATRRNGGWDTFVVPAEGGPVRQLTWHSGSELPFGWSPDGKQILFAGKRESPNFGIYALNVTTLQSDRLCEDYAQLWYPNYSPDGKTIVYGRYGFPWWRPRYTGAAAQQVWLLNTTDNSRRALTQDDRQHLWSRFLPDGRRIVTVTVGEPTPSASPLDEPIPKMSDNPMRTPNLWVFDLQGKATQLTTFIGGGVRSPSVAAKSGDIAFEQGVDVWLLRGGKGAPAKISLHVGADEKQTARRRERITTGVTEAELSPDGKTFAFGLRGEIWTIPTDKPKGTAARNAEFAKRLTDWAGDDSDFSWSHDSKKLYFTSDRDGNSRVYELDVESRGVKCLWSHDEAAAHLHLSPDGKQLGFWVGGPAAGLYTVTLNNGEARRVASVPGSHWRDLAGGFSWSTDMRWIAFMKRSPSRAWNVFVVPSDGGEPVNVTRLNAGHSMPRWGHDGRTLYFQSDREGSGLYALALVPETYRSGDTDVKYERLKEGSKVEIDFNDIHRRIRKLTGQAPQADIYPAPDGTVFFISESDIWSISYDGKETKRLTTGGGKMGFRLANDGRRAWWTQGGEMFHGNASAGLSGTKVTFTAEFNYDIAAQRKAAFAEFWRSYQHNFYDANFHGRDWAAMRTRYEPMLAAVETHEEFASLLSMLVGELEASHTEVQPATNNATTDPVTPHLGFTFDYSHKGAGVKVAAVPPGSPASFKETLINPGEIILAINGTDVSLDEKLFQSINDKQDREFEFLVSTNGSRTGARKVRYRPMSGTEFDDLAYKNRTERLRKVTEQKGNGRIGYLHISAMGFQNQVQFEREAYEYISGKQAMIIDVRFNRGGNISDNLIDMLERRQYGWFRPRDDNPEPQPPRAWDRPVIVLMNEHSYSNGEMFPYSMRQRGLGRIVGMPTPGYVIWTTELRLVDGTRARMPLSGVFRMDGTCMENRGEQPDVQLWLTPDDWLNDRDPQLDKAIELLLPPKPAPTN